jgi:hypothetical protein
MYGAARLAGVACVVAACASAAPRAPAPAAAAPATDPRLAAAEADYRARDRELSDLLADPAPPDCTRVRSIQDGLSQAMGRICAVDGTRDDPHRPRIPCRYAMERDGALANQAERRGCPRRGGDPLWRTDADVKPPKKRE